MPQTVVATSDDELADAIETFPYFGRAVFSRGGVDLLTNTGPLAGALDRTTCHPTPAEPWVVQAFVEGETVCTYWTVHDGKVSAHCVYRIPRQWQHSTGIQFESIDATESLRLIEPIAPSSTTPARSRSTSSSPRRPVASSSATRARPTARCCSRPSRSRAGLLDRRRRDLRAPQGEEKQLDLVLVGDGFCDHMKRLP